MIVCQKNKNSKKYILFILFHLISIRLNIALCVCVISKTPQTDDKVKATL